MSGTPKTPAADGTLPNAAPARFAVLLPAFVAIVVGLPAIRGTFIRDDWDYVAGNPHVACATSIKDLFTSSFQPLKPLGLYRPVTTLSLRVDAMLGGEERPWIFHLTNLLLAGAGAALLAVLAGRLAEGRGREAATRAALAAGLLFAAHPARTEAVCWISGRAENLMTFFALLALVLATSKETLVTTVLAAVAAALSALSKEQGFVLLLLVPCVARPVTGKRLVQMVLVAGALGLAFIARWKALGGVLLKPGLAPFEGLGFSDRFAQGLRLLAEYARATVWPRPLLFEYDTPALRAQGFSDPAVIAGAVILLALVAAIFAGGRRPLISAGAAIFLLPLIPVLQVIVPIGEDFAERFLALPIAGAALIVAAAAARFPAVGFGAAMLVVAACGALFTRHAGDYESARALYEDLVAKAPSSPAAKSLLASTLLLPEGGRPPKPGDAERAETLLREAIASNPGLAPARMTLAALRAQQRAPNRQPPLPADLELLRENAQRFPSLPTVHGMLGLALDERGAPPEVWKPELLRELEISPLDLPASSRLARLAVQERDQKRADEILDSVRSRWEALWRRHPGFAPVAIGYARTLMEGGRDVDGARQVLRQASAAACRPYDKRLLDAALVEAGGK